MRLSKSKEACELPRLRADGLPSYDGPGRHILQNANMSRSLAFAEALDAAEKLDVDSQAELVAVLRRRLAERGRERMAESVSHARREFAAGQCQPMTATELIREAQSTTFGQMFGDLVIDCPDLPTDLAAQHDHYRLGTPKR
jgi:hypothetical protein